MPIPLPSPSHSVGSYVPPGSAGSGYLENMSPMGATSRLSGSAGGAVRPGSSRGRYDPYGTASPRSSSLSLQQQQQSQSSRRLSSSQPQDAGYYAYDVKPSAGQNGHFHYAPTDYSYYGPSSGPAGHPIASPIQSPSSFPGTGSYSAWQQPPSSAGPTRLNATIPRGASSSSPTTTTGGNAGEMNPPPAPGTAHSVANSTSGTGSGSGSPTHPAQSGLNSYQASNVGPAPPPHEWSGMQGGAAWEHGQAHGGHPAHPHYQPPPQHVHGYAPVHPSEWRGGASMAS